MAEQLANLYSTTLASGYTAGAGSISVTSASGAPTSGTFDVAILNAATGAVILLFRVTSVSGTTFTGAAEGADANASSGSTVIGTVLTVASVQQLFNDRGFIQPVTAPIPGAFSNLNFNVGSGIVTTRVNTTSPPCITLIQADPSGVNNLAAIQKSIINSAFTVTVGLTMMGRTGKGSCQALWLNDGSTNGIWFGLYSQNNLTIEAVVSLNGAFSGATNVLVEGFSQIGSGPLFWLRIQETASARNYYFSCDGINFVLVQTESNTAHITTANYGIMAMNQVAATSQVSMYSFAETTP